MKAIAINGFGDYNVFEEMEIEKPEVKEGYVLVKVYASSVNPIETKIRSGLVPAITHPFPAVLNGDLAGVIVEVGFGVEEFKVGDEVFGCAGGVINEGGALAEFMLVDANLIYHKPKNVDFNTAALYPLVGITAWELINDKAEIKEGDKVLIHGATGGVGHLALQLAKIKGAKVYGTVSSEVKGKLALDLGADEVINYKETSVEEYVGKYTNGLGFDKVIDTVGGNNLINSFNAVAKNGVVCTINARTTLDLALMHRKAISLKAVFMLIPLIDKIERERHGIILKGMKELIEKDRLKILKDEKAFSFKEVGKAHEYLETGKATGKISLYNE